MRYVIGGRARTKQAASTSQTGLFETEVQQLFGRRTIVRKADEGRRPEAIREIPV